MTEFIGVARNPTDGHINDLPRNASNHNWSDFDRELEYHRPLLMVSVVFVIALKMVSSSVFPAFEEYCCSVFLRASSSPSLKLESNHSCSRVAGSGWQAWSPAHWSLSSIWWQVSWESQGHVQYQIVWTSLLSVSSCSRTGSGFCSWSSSSSVS